MKRRIRVFNCKGDEVVAEWETGLLTAEAKAEFDKLMADANLCVMDEQEEAPAKTMNPDHNYIAFRRMAGG